MLERMSRMTCLYSMYNTEMKITYICYTTVQFFVAVCVMIHYCRFSSAGIGTVTVYAAVMVHIAVCGHSVLYSASCSVS